MNADKEKCHGCPENYKGLCLAPKSLIGKPDCYRDRKVTDEVVVVPA